MRDAVAPPRPIAPLAAVIASLAAAQGGSGAPHQRGKAISSSMYSALVQDLAWKRGQCL